MINDSFKMSFKSISVGIMIQSLCTVSWIQKVSTIYKVGCVFSIVRDFCQNFDCPFFKQMSLGLIHFLLNHLTLKVYNDSITHDTAPSSGGDELINIKLQRLFSFDTLIRFWWNYHHSIANSNLGSEMGIKSGKFSRIMVFYLKIAFFQRNDTPLTLSDYHENWILDCI